MNIIPIMHVLITFLDEYKKFNCKVSRDGGAKKYTNKGSSTCMENTDKRRPHTVFSSNRVSVEKM